MTGTECPKYEALPGVLGNRGIVSFISGERKSKISFWFWGTRENAEIFQRNKGTGTSTGRASNMIAFVSKTTFLGVEFHFAQKVNTGFSLNRLVLSCFISLKIKFSKWHMYETFLLNIKHCFQWMVKIFSLSFVDLKSKWFALWVNVPYDTCTRWTLRSAVHLPNTNQVFHCQTKEILDIWLFKESWAKTTVQADLSFC